VSIPFPDSEFHVRLEWQYVRDPASVASGAGVSEAIDPLQVQILMLHEDSAICRQICMISIPDIVVSSLDADTHDNIIDRGRLESQRHFRCSVAPIEIRFTIWAVLPVTAGV